MTSRPVPKGNNEIHEMESIDEALSALDGSNEIEGSGAIYAWEQDLDRTWDALIERDDGTLEYVLSKKDFDQNATLLQRSGKSNQGIKKGTIRNLVIVIDMSKSMREVDFRPDRHTCTQILLQEFVKEFFEQNPLSRIAIVSTSDSDAQVLQLLDSVAQSHIRALQNARKLTPSGYPSLRNALERAYRILNGSPLYASKEILVIFGSLMTCDSCDIFQTLDQLKKADIRVSCISLVPELYIVKTVCNETKGDFFLALASDEFRRYLQLYMEPLPWTNSMQPGLLRIGFPRSVKSTTASLCVCHLQATCTGFLCPQCDSKICEIPATCNCCLLQLVSPEDIFRTSQLLFPTAPTEPLPSSPSQTDSLKYDCSICLYPICSDGATCTECKSVLCSYCVAYSHQELKHCPRCMINDVSISGTSN